MGIKTKIDNNIRRFQTKNKFIMADKSRPASINRVNYEWWSSNTLADNNIGDFLAPLINDWMLSKRGIKNEISHGPVFLASVGSVLGLSLNDCTVWGSGLLSASNPATIKPVFKAMDIRAVRGPNTKAFLESRGYKCPSVFGDPGMLMPLLYPGKALPKKGPLVIKHYLAPYVEECDLRYANILTSNYQGFIDELISSTVVISSSLHGIILAEAYGVPAILLNDNRHGFSLFKYEDWYFSTGRAAFPVVSSIEEALETEPAPLPQLDGIRIDLMNAFPYDLWEN